MFGHSDGNYELLIVSVTVPKHMCGPPVVALNTGAPIGCADIVKNRRSFGSTAETGDCHNLNRNAKKYLV